MRYHRDDKVKLKPDIAANLANCVQAKLEMWGLNACWDLKKMPESFLYDGFWSHINGHEEKENCKKVQEYGHGPEKSENHETQAPGLGNQFGQPDYTEDP